jgi:hypothetical protein
VIMCIFAPGKSAAVVKKHAALTDWNRLFERDVNIHINFKNLKTWTWLVS